MKTFKTLVEELILESKNDDQYHAHVDEVMNYDAGPTGEDATYHIMGHGPSKKESFKETLRMHHANIGSSKAHMFDHEYHSNDLDPEVHERAKYSMHYKVTPKARDHIIKHEKNGTWEDHGDSEMTLPHYPGIKFDHKNNLIKHESEK